MPWESCVVFGSGGLTSPAKKYQGAAGCVCWLSWLRRCRSLWWAAACRSAGCRRGPAGIIPAGSAAAAGAAPFCKCPPWRDGATLTGSGRASFWVSLWSRDCGDLWRPWWWELDVPVWERMWICSAESEPNTLWQNLHLCLKNGSSAQYSGLDSIVDLLLTVTFGDLPVKDKKLQNIRQWDHQTQHDIIHL